MAEATPPPGARPERAATLIRAALGAGLLGSALWLDSSAAAAFDAPKRLLACIAIAVAMLVWTWNASLLPPLPHARRARLILGCAALAGVGLVSSTVFAHQPEVARDTLRPILLFACLLPLGASTALAPQGTRTVLACAALAVGINALLSLLQAGGFELPIELARLGGRYPTGALLGNEGYVALACAFALPACLAIALSQRGSTRLMAGLLGTLCIATIAANAQLTAAIAAGAGAITVLALQLQRAAALRTALLIGALGLVTLALPALRDLTWQRLPGLDAATLQQATTYRLGAWLAAERQWQAHPWLGAGPGSYAADSQRARLAAEVALRTRLTPPPTGTHFAQAHNDYLQLAAEAGLPTTLAALAALGLLLHALLPLGSRCVEARALAGVLLAGAVAALAWFPLQVPLLAMLLLLAAGRAWRLVAAAEGSP